MRNIGDGARRVLVTGGSGFIGTHLENLLLSKDYQVFNLDLVAPRSDRQPNWRRASIMEPAELSRVFAEAKPQYVVHLAAYASMDAKSIDEFKVNVEGTRNLLKAVRDCPSVQRLIVTSSQHVRKPGTGMPTDDSDYVPYEFYGESKMLTERETRDSGLSCTWTIIRPTAVWGPNQPPLADGVWQLIKRRLYIHPSNDSVMRSYGYVKNVVWQIERLLQCDAGKIDRKVFYVGDDNMRQYDWINGFALALTGHRVRTAPLAVIRALALVGDVLRRWGFRFPIYGSRLYNLMTPNEVPIRPTLDLLGVPPYSFEMGIRETAEWLDGYYSGRLPSTGLR